MCAYGSSWVLKCPHKSFCVLMDSNDLDMSLFYITDSKGSSWVFICSYSFLWIVMGPYASF